MKLNPNMVYRKIGSESVLVPIGKNVDAVRNIFTLNETAAFVLDRINLGQSPEEICEALKEDYEVQSEAEMKEWVYGIVDEFRANQILL